MDCWCLQTIPLSEGGALKSSKMARLALLMPVKCLNSNMLFSKNMTPNGSSKDATESLCYRRLCLIDVGRFRFLCQSLPGALQKGDEQDSVIFSMKKTLFLSQSISCSFTTIYQVLSSAGIVNKFTSDWEIRKSQVPVESWGASSQPLSRSPTRSRSSGGSATVSTQLVQTISMAV